MGINTTRTYELTNVPTTEQPYLMTADSLKSFLNDIISGDITGYSITNLFQDNSSYVTKAMFFPFDISSLYSTTNLVSGNYICLGKLQKDVANYVNGTNKQIKQVNRMNTTTANLKWFTFTITRNFNNFLDFNPYTKIYIDVPFFGLTEINPIDAYLGEMSVYLIVDVRTGYATIYIDNNDGVTVVHKRVKIAVDISIGKTNAEDIRRNNLLESISLITQIGVVASGIASGNAVSAGVGVGLIGKTIGDTINNNVSRLENISGGGDGRDLQVQDGTIRILIERPTDVKYPNYSLKGGVCRKNDYLENVTGYTEIGEIHFDAKGYDIYDDEIEELTALLRDGVIL